MHGFKGDTIASALHANGVKTLSHSLRYHRPRGFFCGIGKCSSCFMTVENVPNVRTCITPLKENLRIVEQNTVGTLPDRQFIDRRKKRIEVEIVVIGSGPAGLMGALAAADQGASVLLIDENSMVGGQLVKQTHKFFGSQDEKAGTRGIDIAVELMKRINAFENIQLMLKTTVVGCYNEGRNHHRLIATQRRINGDQLFEIHGKKIVFACGAMENMIAFPGSDLPGVYGAGGVQTLMNVYGVKPGNRVLMLGSGNVGLIVSYQLLQANLGVDRIVEIMPKIGGYHVHAAKLRRCGIPICTSRSIKEVYGNEKVEGAVVVAVDSCFQPIPGSEEDVSCDTVCIAVGLTPSIRLLEQIGAKKEFIPEVGGHVAVHDSSMQTNVRGVYVAGDSSGIEEASTAMIEGQLAGVSAAASLGYNKDVRKIQKKCKITLEFFRSGPFGENAKIGKEKIACCWNGGITY
ncbi:MAG: FAD-dependent oxidoreductase [Thermoplasmatales archaeon]|nr:MAG: FAD-dependent oxidoreductase [Thermoplasmatales archaeon]